MPFDAAEQARAGTSPLPFRSFADMHVDYERRHVFVSGGSGTNAIVVFGYDGRQVARIDGLAGAFDLLPDGDLLYVALSNANEIAVVDMKTLERVDTIDISPYAQPLYLSKRGETIYFTHSCADFEGEFASIDLTTRVPVPHDDPRLLECVEHAVVPSDPNTMFVWKGDFEGTLRRFNVTARRPVFLDEEPSGDSFDEITFSKDGETFYARRSAYSPSGTGVDQRRISDYSVVMNYPAAGTFGLTPDERHMLTAASAYNGVSVYRTGSPAPVTTSHIDADVYYDDHVIVAGALRAGPQGDRAFTVVGSSYSYDENLRFRVVWPQYRVAAGPGGQESPAAGNGYEVWTSGSRRARYRSLVARKGGRTFRVNPPKTSGYAGGIDGNRLVYQLVRGRQSDLRLYDLKKRRQIATLDRINTRGWEWHPTLSRGRVLFARGRGPTSRIVLQSLKGGSPRVLATETSRRAALISGQVNGSWAVWVRCERVCDVYRANLKNGGRIKVPRSARRINYSAAVRKDGTVYYMQSGYGCGTDAEILRFAGGRVTEVQDLTTGKDGFFMHADDANDRLLFDVGSCTYRGTAVRWDVMSFLDVPSSRDRAGKAPSREEEEADLPPLEGEPWFSDLLPGGPS